MMQLWLSKTLHATSKPAYLKTKPYCRGTSDIALTIVGITSTPTRSLRTHFILQRNTAHHAHFFCPTTGMRCINFRYCCVNTYASDVRLSTQGRSTQ